MIPFQENARTDGRKDRGTDRPYLTGLFWQLLGPKNKILMSYGIPFAKLELYRQK